MSGNIANSSNENVTEMSNNSENAVNESESG